MNDVKLLIDGVELFLSLHFFVSVSVSTSAIVTPKYRPKFFLKSYSGSKLLSLKYADFRELMLDSIEKCGSSLRNAFDGFSFLASTRFVSERESTTKYIWAYSVITPSGTVNS